VIDGIGIDVVDIKRFHESLVRTPHLKEKLFTESERNVSESSLAARFAAKEALYKALSPEHGLHWHDCEAINHTNGRPDFLFRGEIADLIDGAKVHLSLSHDAGIASAVVVIER
jgi:holo-[acyl-carrier protein] synthase